MYFYIITIQHQEVTMTANGCRDSNRGETPQDRYNFIRGEACELAGFPAQDAVTLFYHIEGYAGTM